MRLGSAQGYVKVITGGGMVELWKVGQGAYVETGTGGASQCSLGGPKFRDFVSAYGGWATCGVLAARWAVNVHASTELASGKEIMSAFPGLAITSEGGNYGPKSMYGEGPLNGGGPMLRVRTTIGQIDIRQLQ